MDTTLLIEGDSILAVDENVNIVQNGTNITFIKLHNTIFAEYNIIYHINDNLSISELSEISNKNQLLFIKFENKIQQLNIVLIDSIFPKILADITLDVMLNNVSTFNEYLKSKKSFTIIETKSDIEFFKYKFFTFINHLLYTNISTFDICRGDQQTDRVYVLKNDYGELEYYSIYEQNKLQFMLLEKMKLEIKFESSKIINEEVNLNLQIRFS